jgi:hypothetical protein
MPSLLFFASTSAVFASAQLSSPPHQLDTVASNASSRQSRQSIV